MTFLANHQLNIMLFMSGICAILAFMTLLTESLSRRKKAILTVMALSAMFLLIFDRLAYIYRGDVSDLGFYMVRISNGLVFFLQVFIPFTVTQFLKDLYRHEGRLSRTPVLLRVGDVLFGVAMVLLAVSQFTGLYYTFDANNLYQRSPGFVLSYAFPLLLVLLQEFTVVQYRKHLNKGLVATLLLGIAFPTIMSVLQIFMYGVSLASMSTVVVVIIFYMYALKALGWAMETARKNELESYRLASLKEAAMFEQTAEALANAIDAKDRYTHGHSARVAVISRQIAAEAGFSEKECAQLYFAALLHDVGKIGIRDDIINKEGKLTDEEFEQIKRHPILGYHILASIRQSPALSIGAHYHHERYNGTGYPDGLAGEDIPVIARIIAVADAYDAMSSNRSYRTKLSEETIRQELIKGLGSQFDPKYGRILLHIIDTTPL